MMLMRRFETRLASRNVMRALNPRVRWENDTLGLQWGRRLKGDTHPIIHFTSRQSRSKHFLFTDISLFALISCDISEKDHSSIVLKTSLFRRLPTTRKRMRSCSAEVLDSQMPSDSFQGISRKSPLRSSLRLLQVSPPPLPL